MGINHFSDMTLEEFTELYGKTGFKVRSSKRPMLRDNAPQMSENSTLPEEVDWHKAGKMTQPSD